MAARFINSPGVNLNTLATLASLQEQNKLAAKNRSMQMVGQVVQGLAGVAGAAIQGYQRKKQQEYKTNWEMTQEKLEKRLPLTADEAGSLGLFDENGVPQRGFVMPEEPPKERAIQTRLLSRPDATYAVQTNPTTGEITSRVIENVPGVPISQNIGYMNLLDKKQQEEIRKAEKIHADAVNGWTKKWMRGGRLKKGAPPKPNLADYYKGYGIAVPAVTVNEDPAGLY